MGFQIRKGLQSVNRPGPLFPFAAEGGKWFESACCGCAEHLLWQDDDDIHVAVNARKQVTGMLCARCFKRLPTRKSG